MMRSQVISRAMFISLTYLKHGSNNLELKGIVTVRSNDNLKCTPYLVLLLLKT